MSLSQINTALRNRIGIRNMFQSLDYVPLDSDLTTSQSGLWVNSVNETFLRPEIIDSYLEFAEGFNNNDWDVATNYGQLGGQFVLRERNDKTQAYVSKVTATDNIGLDPISSPNEWESFLSYRLKQTRETAINETVQDLTTAKHLAARTQKVKEYDRLWHQETRPTDLQISDNFRCVNIVPSSKNAINLEITEVAIIADTAQTFNFYLYHTDDLPAIQTFSITIDTSEVNRLVWKNLEDSLGNPLVINEKANSGGIYLFGFYEDDIAGNIKSWEYNYYSPTIVGSPWVVNYYAWKAFSPYYSFYPSTYSQQNKPQLPDVGQYFDQAGFDEEISFNLKIKIFEDYTNLLLDNVEIIDNLIKLKWAIGILQEMKHTFRINSKADKAEEIENILMKSKTTKGTEGHFTETYTGGLYERYAAELKLAKEQLTTLTTNNFGLVQSF